MLWFREEGLLQPLVHTGPRLTNGGECCKTNHNTQGLSGLGNIHCLFLGELMHISNEFLTLTLD